MTPGYLRSANELRMYFVPGPGSGARIEYTQLLRDLKNVEPGQVQDFGSLMAFSPAFGSVFSEAGLAGVSAAVGSVVLGFSAAAGQGSDGCWGNS